MIDSQSDDELHHFASFCRSRCFPSASLHDVAPPPGPDSGAHFLIGISSLLSPPPPVFVPRQHFLKKTILSLSCPRGCCSGTTSLRSDFLLSEVDEDVDDDLDDVPFRPVAASVLFSGGWILILRLSHALLYV